LYGAFRLNRTSKARSGLSPLGLAAAVLLAAIGASSYEACSVYDSSLLAGFDAQGASGDGAGGDGGCVHAEPPARPPETDAATTASFTVVAAFKTIDIGLSAQPDAGIPPFGYDLDKVCTCPGPPSCQQQMGAPETCDDDGGRDNTDIGLFRVLGAAASTGTSQIDQGLSQGQYGLLLVVNNYNGLANDSNVTVDFYVSNGLEPGIDGGPQTPLFNGSDRWTRDHNSVAGDQGPVYTDDAAYVSDYFVVSQMPKAIPIAFGDRSFLGGATMILNGALIVGQLVQVSVGDAGLFGYAMNGGTIAGRWSTRDLLATLATIPDSQNDAGGFLCGSSISYQIIKTVVCQTADISESSSNDNKPVLAPCDAISVGLQFTAVPAQLGEVTEVPAAPAGCGDGGVPFSDKCSP
jgi:hypothetical protein